MPSAPPIALLSPLVIDHIAAGEVVERPASVVKELLENALDAAAQTVHIELQDGGLQDICLTDDGCGMAEADARLCVMRHATSKLRQAEDLFRIGTLGFRGEALAAIAAVSDLTVTTRLHHAVAGFCLRVRAGVVIEAQAAGCPPGTTVRVRDLFFNTPARRKFMKSPATEQAHVAEAVTRVMLGSRRGGVVLRRGARRLIDIPADAAPAERLTAALGARVGILHPVAAEIDAVRVSGFVGTPEIDRGDARGLWFFVNGRFVRDRMLQRAVVEVFRTHLSPGRYPTAVLYVDLPAEAVDVNVHPQKLEVRFASGQTVFRAVCCALGRAVQERPGSEAGLWRPRAAPSPERSTSLSAAPLPPTPEPVVSTETGAEVSTEVGARVSTEAAAAATAMPPAAAPCVTGESTPHAVATVKAPPPQAGQLQLLGTVFDRYFIGHDARGLVLVDWTQIACHQAVAQLMAEAQATGVRQQPLLLPEILSAAPPWAGWLETTWERLVIFGCAIEPVAPNRYAVRAIPEALVAAPALAVATACVEAAHAAGVSAAAQSVPQATLQAVFAACAAQQVQLPALDIAQASLADCHALPGMVRLSRTDLARLMAQAKPLERPF